ncbi:MAG: hypothetical protein ABI354_02840, partial [Candidatus Saccharimonadales bacterium]
SYQADTVLYATDSKATAGMVDIRAFVDSKDYLVRTVSQSPTYLLDMAQFSDHMYIAVGSATDGRVFIYKDALKALNSKPDVLPLPSRALVEPNPEYVSFSAIARFISVQSGSKLAVFDAETGRQFKYDTKLSLVPGQKAVWMDGHRLTLVDTNNKLNVFDFDGTNQQTLNAALPAFQPFFDRDYNVLYTVAPGEAAPALAQLNRTRLKLLPAGQSE